MYFFTFVLHKVWCRFSKVLGGGGGVCVCVGGGVYDSVSDILLHRIISFISA